MYKTISVIAALALLASVVPIAQAEENYAERNIEWIIENYDLDQYSMDTEGTLFGETTTLGEALDTMGERSERVDLAAIMTGASHLGGVYAGDVWIIGTTAGCPADNVIAPGHGQSQAPDPQLILYPYPIQQVTAAGALSVAGWTTKDAGVHAQAEIVGVTDNWCFEFFGIGLYFPYINGVVVAS